MTTRNATVQQDDTGNGVPEVASARHASGLAGVVAEKIAVGDRIEWRRVHDGMFFAGRVHRLRPEHHALEVVRDSDMAHIVIHETHVTAWRAASWNRVAPSPERVEAQ